MFQDGSLKAIMPTSSAWTWSKPGLSARCFPQSQPPYTTKGYNTPKGATFLWPFSGSQNWCWPVDQEVNPTMSGWSPTNATDFKRFPFNNFTYCLTLFPKFFSSFPHGTCSLSVSRQYLALDGIYHPFRAAFPNNSTRWEHNHNALVVHVKDGILTLCDAPFQETYTRSSAGYTSLGYNSDSETLPDFKFELFPLHSQLLRESLLVSFPPLIDMLKFSG